MNNKNYKFLTFKEQIDHLRNNRHLIIGDYEKLIDFLSKYNYDNLVNSYNKFFLKAENRNEYKNCNSDSIIYLFIFDKKISIKILKSVLDIERQISTAIVYLLPKIYKEKIDKINRGEILTLTSFEWDLIFPNFYDNKTKLKLMLVI